MRIGVDIDNVLSNFNEALLKDYVKHDKELGNKGIINNNIPIRKMFDWSADEEKKYYKENIERLANSFEPIKGCAKYIKIPAIYVVKTAKYIKKLREEGRYICIISGRDNGDYKDPYVMTINWLKKYNIEYDKLILTNGRNHQEKADVCIKNNIDIMIDDSRKVCEKCFEKNIKPIIFNTNYNKKELRFKRVYNWKEIYDYVKKLG